MHRLTLELADNKLSLEDATLGRSKDQVTRPQTDAHFKVPGGKGPAQH